jgi:hypothetical protein
LQQWEEEEGRIEPEVLEWLECEEIQDSALQVEENYG